MDPARSGEDLPRPDAVRWRLHAGNTVGPWRVVRPLGRGNVGQVYLVRATAAPGRTAALKLFSNQAPDENKSALQRELRVYLNPDLAAFAPRLLESGTTDPGPYLVLELAETFAPSRKLSVRKIRRLFLALADAIDAFHRAGFILCDFKIGNFGLVGNRLVLFDFDAACTVAESLFARSATFTKWYVAREVWRDGIITPAADVFSIGHALQVVSTLARTNAFNDLIATATAPERGDRLPDMPAFKSALADCKPIRHTVKAAALTLLALGALFALVVGFATALFHREQVADDVTNLQIIHAEASFKEGRDLFDKHDYKMAVLNLERALSVKGYDNAEAHGMLAKCYNEGWGVKHDSEKAHKHAAYAAQLGDERGKEVLGALNP